MRKEEQFGLNYCEMCIQIMFFQVTFAVNVIGCHKCRRATTISIYVT